MNNEFYADFEDILQDTALEHDIEITPAFIKELHSQLVSLFGDCHELEDELSDKP
jgi:hypothetical protein